MLATKKEIHRSQLASAVKAKCFFTRLLLKVTRNSKFWTFEPGKQLPIE